MGIPLTLSYNLSCPHLDFLNSMQLSSLDKASPDCDPNAFYIQWNNNLCRTTGETSPYEAKHLLFAVPSFASMCDS